MKKLFCIFMATCLLLLSACAGTAEPVTTGTESAASGEVTTEAILTPDEIYQNYLVRLHRKLVNIFGDDTHLDGFGSQLGMCGVNEIALQDRLNLLNKVGYAFVDINGDNATELVIFEVNETEGDTSFGTKILCAYTVKDNAEHLILEGSEKQQYSLLEDGSIYYEGTSNAADKGFGCYVFDGSNCAVNCVDFYFTELANEQNKLYHNQSGKWISSESESFDGDEAAFWELRDTLASTVKEIKITPFAAFAG